MKKLLFSTVSLLILNGGAALAAETHGLVTVENYYVDDSSMAYDLNLLTTRLRLDVDKLDKAGTLSFHFDGRERNNLGSKDYSSSIKNERIDTLNMEYLAPSKRHYLSLGRLWPKELAAERVDGVNAVYQSGAAGMGAFGGFKPNPYTEEFNSDFTTAGIYGFYRKDELTGSLALIHNGYKGGTDRQYIYGQSTWSPVNDVRMYAFMTADINPQTNEVDLTNAMAEVSYRPVYSSSISVGYNQFKAIRFYKSMEFDIVDTKQQAYYIRGDHRFLNRYSIYGRYELRSQYYQLLNAEQRYSNTYQAGFRNDNLMESGVTLDANATFDYSYSSTHNTYRMDLSRYFMEVLQLSVNGSYMENKYDLNDYSDTVSTYGASGYLTLGRRWSLSLSYEGRQATDYSSNSVMSRVSYRF